MWCSAMVSSTTPRFGPMWPPFFAVTAISSSRISAASWGSCAGASAFTSLGPRIVSRTRAGAGAEDSFITKGKRRKGATGSGVALGLEFFKHHGAVFLFLELLDLELGVLEARLADLEQLGAF